MKHAFLLAALLLSCSAPLHAAEASKPNIIFILADDKYDNPTAIRSESREKCSKKPVKRPILESAPITSN